MIHRVLREPFLGVTRFPTKSLLEPLGLAWELLYDDCPGLFPGVDPQQGDARLMHSLMNTINSLKQSGAQSSSVNMTKVIAENIFRDLRSHGLRDKDIVAVSSEILNRLTLDIRSRATLDGESQAERHLSTLR